MRTSRELARRGRVLSVAVSASAHVAVLLALVVARVDPPRPAEPPAMTVSLVRFEPPPTPSVAPPAPEQEPAPVKPPPPPPVARRPVAPTPHVIPEPVSHVRSAESGPGMSASERAGAATAGSGASGASGRPCDMVRWLQAALRKDPMVQSAVSGLNGKAVRVWDGDWVRSGGEDGKGMAAVREAIMWEVAFAPKACRAEPVHGLVVLAMNEGAGSTRLAMGAGYWRWSDLLTPHRYVESE